MDRKKEYKEYINSLDGRYEWWIKAVREEARERARKRRQVIGLMKGGKRRKRDI